MQTSEWLKPDLFGADAPDRDIAQSCLASLDVPAMPQRAETAVDAG